MNNDTLAIDVAGLVKRFGETVDGEYQNLAVKGGDDPLKGISGELFDIRLEFDPGDATDVTLGIRGVVSCLDAASGKVLWRKDDFKGTTPRFFTAASPLVTDGLAIVQLGGGEEGGVVAYDLTSGADSTHLKPISRP